MLAQTARLRRKSEIPVRPTVARYQRPPSRRRNQCRTSERAQALRQVVAKIGQSGRTSTQARRQTSASAYRAAVRRGQAASPVRQRSRGPYRFAAPSSAGASHTAAVHALESSSIGRQWKRGCKSLLGFASSYLQRPAYAVCNLQVRSELRTLATWALLRRSRWLAHSLLSPRRSSKPCFAG